MDDESWMMEGYMDGWRMMKGRTALRPVLSAMWEKLIGREVEMQNSAVIVLCFLHVHSQVGGL